MTRSATSGRTTPSVRLGVILLTVWLLVGLGCRAHGGAQPSVLRLAHGLDTTHPVHRAMVHMAELVAERSGGELTIEIFPSEQLGSERECLELLQIGSLDMTKVSASVLENFAPPFRILGLPYLFRDRAHERAVLGGEIGRELLRTPESKRLRGLCYFDAGSRSFYTRDRRVETPVDLEGLKIRTQESATAMRMVEALGGSPTPISWGELYSALQQGVVDGAENNPPSFYLSRHYEVCRYYTLDEHTAVPDVLLIGTRTWDRLSERQRDWLQEAVAEAEALQRELWSEATREALAAVTEAGVEVIRPDKSLFAEQAVDLLDSYRDDAQLWPWIERVRATHASGEVP